MYPYTHENPNNFIKLHNWIPFRTTYCYLDTEDYTADQFFVRRRIPVRYHKGEWHKADTNFVFIIVSIPSRCEPGFEEAMCELKNATLVKGHKDYVDVCNTFQKEATKIYEERKKKK